MLRLKIISCAKIKTVIWRNAVIIPDVICIIWYSERLDLDLRIGESTRHTAQENKIQSHVPAFGHVIVHARIEHVRPVIAAKEPIIVADAAHKSFCLAQGIADPSLPAAL